MDHWIIINIFKNLSITKVEEDADEVIVEKGVVEVL